MARLSLNTATTKGWTLREAVEGAARAGLPAVGLWRDRVAEAGLEESARIVREAGLRVSSLCRGGFLTAADDAGIDAALQDNRAAIIEAATLGTSELVFVVGGLPAASTFGGAALPYPADRAADGEASTSSEAGRAVVPGADPARDLVASRQRVADRIGELVPVAQEHGVRIVLEPLHPMFAADRAVISTLGQALDLAAPFPAETVGVVVDTYHVWWDPELERQITRAGAEGRIAGYQTCDFLLPFAADPLLSRGHVGDGYVDFATITRWVTAAGYTGDVEVEIFNQTIWDTPGDQTLATMAARHRTHVLPHL
ncbi:sugar phosphate isomerase/epimerase [Actinotalea sp. BY-33]|uniref:Sugar phosphate isomerase/epimerase n=1 Tax=Actinotalea soli TaxID=2819234 RepID=A0A939RWB8_9CELL|nr:sugar phosphate isomerase/epimerase [Actinotalea soli]